MYSGLSWGYTRGRVSMARDGIWRMRLRSPLQRLAGRRASCKGATRPQPATVRVDGQKEPETERRTRHGYRTERAGWNARSRELVHGRDQGECEEGLAPMDCDRAQSKQSDGEREHEERATDAEQPLKESECNEIRSIWLWHWQLASQEKRSVDEARNPHEPVHE